MRRDKLSDRILEYLKENPRSTPREIADNVGVSISTVRRILYFLRDRGLVKRVDRGYIAISHADDHEKPSISKAKSIKEKQPHGENETLNVNITNVNKEATIRENKYASKLGDDKWLYEIISNIMKQISSLEQRLRLLERELESIKEIVSKEGAKHYHEKYIDRLVEIIRHEKVIPLSMALNYATKPIEYYVEQKLVIPLGKYIVDYDFYVNFKEKIPLKTDEIKQLDEKEKQLLRILVDEGIVYLYKGREYRMISSENS